MKLLDLKIRMVLVFSLTCFFVLSFYETSVIAQQTGAMKQSQEKSLRYRPEGDSFVIYNGNKKFNRALYGTNTVYRTEAGDLPEFALYGPGMGGNLRFAVSIAGKSKWITEFSSIKASYRPGSMLYEISDREYLGQGKILLSILSSSNRDGLLIQASFVNTAKNLNLIWVFGGASGKRFSREGDIGADPESVFYLHRENCLDNEYRLHDNGFILRYGSGKVAPTPDKKRTLIGVFPKASYKIVNISSEKDPLSFLENDIKDAPVFTGHMVIDTDQTYYFSIYKPEEAEQVQTYKSLKKEFNDAEAARKSLVDRVKVNTPDPFINTLGGSLAIAADGIWEFPTYLHGAVAWRMRLNAWRGAYIADILGWHDRAKAHFSSYANSQVLSPEDGPVVSDTALNLARQKEVMGTSMFSSGYISRNPNANNRPHHYNMNLVFFDQIYTHFKWTRDLSFLEKMWPALERNIKWEKRNYDADRDGLYDAYAAIWASDGLQYSGGGVTHTTAYNYRANREMARLAKILGKDAEPYEKEASHILKAMQRVLWMSDRGWYAEFVDKLGNKLLHPQAGVWSIYHAIDSRVPDAFEAYQSLRYIDTQIPHIPIRAKGLSDKDYYTISTTNWHPYTWSVNNVALAEVMHTSLAYWQGGRSEAAFKLWESALIESMYLGASPGNFQQLSSYDAMRGELYRDFADPIAMVGRGLVEGLFGIQPDAFENKLLVEPGLPQSWDYASLSIPDIDIDFKRNKNIETYKLNSKFPFEMNLELKLRSYSNTIKKISINGKPSSWSPVQNSIGQPSIIIHCGTEKVYEVRIEWGDERIPVNTDLCYAIDENLNLTAQQQVEFLALYDPQKILKDSKLSTKRIESDFENKPGDKTFFVKVKSGQMSWFQPIHVKLIPALYLSYNIKQKAQQIAFDISSSKNVAASLIVNDGKPGAYIRNVNIQKGNNEFTIDEEAVLVPGSNRITLRKDDKILLDTVVINWNINGKPATDFETINITAAFNDQLNRIFKNKYLNPRPSTTTLQIPTQGIGNWCYPLINPEIDDSGLRLKSQQNGGKILYNQIPFLTPSATSAKNIVFTSQWDNFPSRINLPLNGKSSHAYILMAGTTNHMQSRLVNAMITVEYADGSKELLELKNPENWWPIEQDYFVDNYAFAINYPRPPRLHLKTGNITLNNQSFKTIAGFSAFGIEGGAATILDVPLNGSKVLKQISLETRVNEVIVGIMAITLLR